jgi:hypothetical protein
MPTPPPAEHYREKAIELRKLASGIIAPNARKEFEAIAVRYEKLADYIEGADAEQRRQRKRE